MAGVYPFIEPTATQGNVQRSWLGAAVSLCVGVSDIFTDFPLDGLVESVSDMPDVEFVSVRVGVL
jgi:hypothetical protein